MMKTISALVLSLYSLSAISADSFWQRNDDRWCLRSETRTTCLPSDYFAKEITTDQILFVWKDDLLPGRFVRYYFEPVQPGKTWMPADEFVLASEHTTEATYVAKYVADSGSGAPHDATLFFMTLSSEFTLVMYGGDSEAISDLAQSIVQQWEQQLRARRSRTGMPDEQQNVSCPVAVP